MSLVYHDSGLKKQGITIEADFLKSIPLIKKSQTFSLSVITSKGNAGKSPIR
jgi:hypothetical protein